MENCVIVPTNYLEAVEGRARHLVLAHLLAENLDYLKFYRREAQNGSTIIVDNSSFEKGDDWVTPRELLDIYDSLESPTAFLMAPEVAFNGKASAKSASDYVDFLDSIGRSNIPIFATCHGKDLEDVKSCYKSLLIPYRDWETDRKSVV